MEPSTPDPNRESLRRKLGEVSNVSALGEIATRNVNNELTTTEKSTILKNQALEKLRNIAETLPDFAMILSDSNTEYLEIELHGSNPENVETHKGWVISRNEFKYGQREIVLLDDGSTVIRRNIPGTKQMEIIGRIDLNEPPELGTMAEPHRQARLTVVRGRKKNESRLKIWKSKKPEGRTIPLERQTGWIASELFTEGTLDWFVPENSAHASSRVSRISANYNRSPNGVLLDKDSARMIAFVDMLEEDLVKLSDLIFKKSEHIPLSSVDTKSDSESFNSYSLPAYDIVTPLRPELQILRDIEAEKHLHDHAEQSSDDESATPNAIYAPNTTRGVVSTTPKQQSKRKAAIKERKRELKRQSKFH